MINHELGMWKSDVVERPFLPYEASLILGIPLSFRMPPDDITWGLTPNGIFSKKSAYKMLVALDNSGEAGNSSPDPQLKFWKSLWSLRVPNKVKHFAWRDCNNALPTMVNLQHRLISTSDLCEQCMTEPKDTFRALWVCSKLEEVWCTLSWTLPVAQAPPLSFNALLDFFFAGEGRL